MGPCVSPFYSWLQEYGLPTDGSADSLDAYIDGQNAWQEWKAWTVPTNSLSVLRLFPPQPVPTGMAISWQSVLGQCYVLERAADVSGLFSVRQTGIVGQAGTTRVTDTNITGDVVRWRTMVRSLDWPNVIPNFLLQANPIRDTEVRVKCGKRRLGRGAEPASRPVKRLEAESSMESFE